MSRIIILGLFDDDVPKLKNILRHDDTIWALNDFFLECYYPNINPGLIFNLHVDAMRERFGRSTTLGKIVDYHGEYNRFKCPIVLWEKCGGVNLQQYIFDTSIYPKMLKLSRRQVNWCFSSSITMMLAFAFMRGHRDIFMHGIAMQNIIIDSNGKIAGEAGTQTVPLLYFVNLLRKKGMRIIWPYEKDLRVQFSPMMMFKKCPEAKYRYGDDDKCYGQAKISIMKFIKQ